MVGSFTCKCRAGLVRGEGGECITTEQREAQREAKKAAKKKKRKKRKKEEGNEEAESEERRVYPWYYTLAPLTGSYLVYKYWRPNLVTSAGIILFISASATLDVS